MFQFIDTVSLGVPLKVFSQSYAIRFNYRNAHKGSQTKTENPNPEIKKQQLAEKL